jgi:putative redox protein
MIVEKELKLKTMQVELNRVDGDFHFAALGSDKVAVHIDGAAAIGGTHAGARPMELILMGLGGCSAIDVILILKKSRQVVEDLRIVVKGQREEDANPSPFLKIHINFIFKGKLKPEKVETAIRLSMEKYCSVTAMLEKTANITWGFDIEE